MQAMITVHTLQGTHRLEAQVGEPLMAVLQRGHAAPDAPCGGKQHCGKCRIRILEGTLPEPTAAEQAFLPKDDPAVRLACFVAVPGDMTVQVETEGGDAVIRTDGLSVAVTPYGQAQWQDGRLMQGDTCLAEGEPFAPLGAAVDIGTTTVVVYLVDLATGERLGTASALNPQKRVGDDVITRIDYARQNEAQLLELQAMVLDCISGLLRGLCEAQQVPMTHVVRMTIAGNTVMLHLAAGVDPRTIAVAPFTPVFTALQCCEAQALGLPIAPKAPIYLLPNVAGYVGADIVAGVVAAGLDETHETVLLVDIGTNGEMVLCHKGQMVCCATAAGPALEGAHIRCGMGGIDGAIDHVALTPDGFTYSVLGHQAPRGICGSGLVDAVAALLKAGAMDESGFIDPDAEGPLAGHLEDGDRGGAFRLAEGVTLDQADIREVQLAKAAIAAGMQVMMAHFGIEAEAVHHVALAGGFGSFIDKDHACDIGLVLPALRGRIEAIGNSAGMGALMALIDARMLDRMQAAADSMAYLELSGRSDFNDAFMDQMYFEEALV